MSEERVAELQILLYDLERKIQPLAWDAGRNQINEFKKTQLKTLQKQHSEFAEELEKLQEEQ
jgi:hypothetical protein